MSREEELLSQAIERLKVIQNSKSYIERVKIENNEDTDYEGKTITISVDYEPKQDKEESSTDNEVTETIQSLGGEVIEQRGY